MKKVKIYGAGSIGNHLSRAFRTLDFEVFVCDTDKEALTRMKDKIYPSRYGEWDENIHVFSNEEIPENNYDFVVIGTPPDSHTDIAIDEIEKGSKNILIEKPLSYFGDKKIDILKKRIKENETNVFIGYNHIVSKSIQHLSKILKEKILGNTITFDVDFRENWEGIFRAHPWLDGPKDSYLGYINKGGGALSEHSHALNLWQHISEISGSGDIKEIQPIFKFNSSGKLHYDEIAMLNIKTDKTIGRVVQDVVTSPHTKIAKIICEKGSIEWICNYENNSDRIIIKEKDNEEFLDFKKSREDDFLQEVKYVNNCVQNNIKENDISFSKGLKTFLWIEKCFSS